MLPSPIKLAPIKSVLISTSEINMSKLDDLALALSKSIVVLTLDLGVAVWKYRISKNKYGYYVATRQMTEEEFLNCGCVYPKVDSKGRITALADAINYAQDRLNWVRKYIERCTSAKVVVLVLNGPIAVYPEE